MATADFETSPTSPTFERRPWGAYSVLDDGDDCKVKRMTVDPGQRLSYQSHARRAEHWVVVSGKATVTLDGTDHTVEPGSSIDIPLGAAHRVANHGTLPLVFIEVQLGDYFGEDDIVRYSDDYGRVE
jgi:mannose-6-phosphate isomerase